MNDLVSVIVPIYNVEDDLKNCVDSIIHQTYRNLEIILVDDGSPDNCGSIADDYSRQDDRVRVIHKQNGGLSDARNAGLDVASGEYITFVDSDDFLSEGFVEELVSLTKKHDCDISICDHLRYRKSNGIHFKHDSEIKEIEFSSKDAIKEMFYQKQFDVSAWGKLYKKNTFEGLFFPMGYNFEDIPTIYKAFLKTDKIVYSSRKLYFYQVRDNSIENSEFNIKKMDCIKTAEMMFKDIQSNYPELIKAARSRYVAANIHILAQIKKPIKEKSYICSNLRIERHKVLFDREATLRTRGACLISYFGFGTLTKLLNRMNRVKVKKMAGIVKL